MGNTLPAGKKRRSIINSYIRKMESGFPVDNFPEDIIQNIFVHLNGKDLIHSCRIVSKRWKSIVDLQTLWKIKCHKRRIYAPNVDIEVDYKHLYFFNPYTRNLIKNGNATEGFTYWKITSNGGDRFVIEDDKGHGANKVSSIGEKELRHCWATSYNWCVKEQTIDFLQEGVNEEVLDKIRPVISISEWTTARKDCGSKYVMKVYLLDKEKKVLASCDKENIVPQWTGGVWIQITHDFEEYPKGVRFIRFSHGGKDNQFWAGHYGPKFTGASVKFVFHD